MRAIKSMVFCLVTLSLPVLSQNVMTSSPYSMFGLGEMASGLYGQQVAMGGSTYGMRDAMYMNVENPAGLTALDSCRLLLKASAFIRGEQYHSGGGSSRTFTGNVSAFSLGGRLMPRWYMAASVTPYSVTGYYFNSTQPIEGTTDGTSTSIFEGSGGLSKATLSQAVLLPRAFSLGINLSYVFGRINQQETQGDMSVTEEKYAHTLYADFGVQYTRRFRQDVALTLGAVYGYQQKLKVRNSVTVTGSNATDESRRKSETQYLPAFWGLGGALAYKKWTYALDYTFRQYGSLRSGDSRATFRDAHEMRMGVCYFPNGYTSGSYWRRVSYKAGFGLSTPYLSIDKHSGLGIRASLGLGLPVLNGRVNVALFCEQMRLQGNVFRKQVKGLTVSYTISERFHRVKL